MRTVCPEDFADWRRKARALVVAGTKPEELLWSQPSEGVLFEESLPADPPAGSFRVPRQFMGLATKASLHRSPKKWGILYRVLWKLVNENPHLLNSPTDPDVKELYGMEGEVRRDCHKMKAFVRFRKDSKDNYAAWHEPSHLIVKAVSPFFCRRFSSMNWAILTPDCSAYWDQETLRFGPGLPRQAAPQEDELEELWTTYYANIFNPARVKIQAMVTEMPKKYWHTMPETAIISQLLQDAPNRVNQMIDKAAGRNPAPETLVKSAIAEKGGLEELRALACECRGCEIHESATQTVFGEGSHNPRIVFVGEQPGDQEDRAGRPFVGPAGQLFRRCLRRINMDLDTVYITNVVKHFRWEESPRGGKRRIHKRANWRQIETCKPWVEAELSLLQPRVLVLLGATALQALVDREARIGRSRGRKLDSPLATHVLATVHPSSLLRVRDAREQQQEIDKFCRDLQLAHDLSLR